MIDGLEEKCKELISNRKYDECEKEIIKAMDLMPHSAIPHNLMGILCGIRQDKVLAMKHFRAAYGLDPTYIPSRYNMEQFGRPYAHIDYKFSEEDCIEKKEKYFRTMWTENILEYLNENGGILVWQSQR